MTRRERYFLTEPTRRTRDVLIGPAIGSDGAEISLKQKRETNRPLVPLPDRLEDTGIYNFRFFRAYGTALKEGGAQGTLDDINGLVDYELL